MTLTPTETKQLERLAWRYVTCSLKKHEAFAGHAKALDFWNYRYGEGHALETLDKEIRRLASRPAKQRSKK